MSQSRTREMMIAAGLAGLFLTFVRAGLAQKAASRIKKSNEELEKLDELDDKIHGEE